jgi:putative oligomerization/nucleic acid binding protein
MPFMRRRPLLRAAAIGGGAYAIGKHRAQSQQEQQQQPDDAGAAAAAPAAAPAPAGITSQDTDRLAELGRLHESGVLTDDEFTQEKAKILGL